jgi:hypothetical protein
VVTIAPTFSPGSVTRYRSEAGYAHEIQWSRDTIRGANASTVVEILERDGRITGVDVEIYHWYRNRWRSDVELARELFPTESAALETIIDRWLTTRPTTQPTTQRPSSR